MIVLFLAVLNAAVFYWITDGILGPWVPGLPYIVAAVAFLAVPLAVALFSMPVSRRSPSVDVPSMSGTARDGYTQDRAGECWSDGCNRLTLPGEIVCPPCRDENRRQEDLTDDLRRRGLL